MAQPLQWRSRSPYAMLFRPTKRLATSLALLACFFTAGLSRAEEPTVPALTLDEAIQQALTKNYAIRVVSFNAPIARANLTTQWGRFDPSIQLSYKFKESGDPQGADPITGARPPSYIVSTDSYEAGLGGLMPWGLRYTVGLSTVNQRDSTHDFAHTYYSFTGVTFEQPLLRDFGFGAGLASIRIAKADRAISECEYRQQLTDTITQVIYAYNDLYLAQASLRVARRSRELAASLLAENERRYQVGNVAESDVTAAKARVAFRENSVLSAERSVDAQSNALRLLISDEHTLKLLSGPIEIAPPPPPAAVTADTAADFREALLARPDYQRSRIVVQRQRLNRGYQRNQFLPQVNLVGSYGYHGIGDTWPESRHNMDTRDTRSYSAGAVVTIPLTFAQERGRLRAANLQLRQSQAQVEQLEQQIVVDLGNAAAELTSTQKRMVAARLARQAAQQSLDDEIKLHRVGKSSTLFVLQAQEYLSQAEMLEYAAAADARKAVAEYDRQVGRTLKHHGVQIESTAKSVAVTAVGAGESKAAAPAAPRS